MNGSRACVCVCVVGMRAAGVTPQKRRMDTLQRALQQRVLYTLQKGALLTATHCNILQHIATPKRRTHTHTHNPRDEGTVPQITAVCVCVSVCVYERLKRDLFVHAKEPCNRALYTLKSVYTQTHQYHEVRARRHG